MSVDTLTGAKIYIGTKAAATDLSSYQSDSYTEIGEIESFTPPKDVQNFVSFLALGDGRERTYKTTRKGDGITLTCGFDAADAGQIALRAADADTTNTPFNIKIVYTDGDSTVSPVVTPTTAYFSGHVGNLNFPGGGAEDVGKCEFMLTQETAFVVSYAA